MKTNRRHITVSIVAVLALLTLITMACSLTDKVFVDTEATNQAVQKTQVAEDARATERALNKTQEALNEQATQQAQEATQNAEDAQATQQAQEATQQALQQPQYPQPPQQQGGAGYNLYIVNNSSQTICYLYVALSSETSWGDDLLGNETIPAGNNYTLTNVPAGRYDFKAEDCNHNQLATQNGVDIPQYDTWTVYDINQSGGGTASLYIVNNSSQTICYVYISLNTSSNWGNDWLGNETIPAGSSYTFYNVSAGYYDLKAEDCNHNVLATYTGFDFPNTYDTWTITN